MKINSRFGICYFSLILFSFSYIRAGESAGYVAQEERPSISIEQRKQFNGLKQMFARIQQRCEKMQKAQEQRELKERNCRETCKALNAMFALMDRLLQEK